VQADATAGPQRLVDIPVGEREIEPLRIGVATAPPFGVAVRGSQVDVEEHHVRALKDRRRKGRADMPRMGHMDGGAPS